MEVEERRFAEEEFKRKGLLEEAKLVATSSGLEEELKIERDWRQNLEKTIENEKDKVADVNAEMEQLRKVPKALDFYLSASPKLKINGILINTR